MSLGEYHVTDLEKLNDVMKDLGVSKRIQFGTTESLPKGRIALDVMGSLFVFDDDGVFQGTLSQDMANESWKRAEKNPIKDGNDYYDETTDTSPPTSALVVYQAALQNIVDSGGMSAGVEFGGAATHMVNVARKALDSAFEGGK